MTRLLILLFCVFTIFSCAKKNDKSAIIPPPISAPTISGFSPAKGNAGLDITITGRNFASDRIVVKFNEVTAPIKKVTSDTIIATVPQGVSTGKIMITVGDSTVISDSTFIILSGNWIRRTDFGGTPRGAAVAFTIGKKAYLFSGWTPPSSFNEDFWEFDSTNFQWTRKADFPAAARESAIAFSIGNKGYFGFGYDNASQELKDFWEYDPGLDTWTRKTDFPGTGRISAFGFAIDTLGYVGTGIGSAYMDVNKDFWQYSATTNQWTQKANFPGIANFNCMATSSQTLGYVIGGTSGTLGYAVASKEVWQYDPSQNRWSQLGKFTSGTRTNGCAFVIDNKLFAGFGDSATTFRDLWEYNPVDSIWRERATCPGSQRTMAAYFQIGSSAFVATGFPTTIGGAQVGLDDVWQFVP